MGVQRFAEAPIEVPAGDAVPPLVDVLRRYTGSGAIALIAHSCSCLAVLVEREPAARGAMRLSVLPLLADVLAEHAAQRETCVSAMEAMAGAVYGAPPPSPLVGDTAARVLEAVVRCSRQHAASGEDAALASLDALRALMAAMTGGEQAALTAGVLTAVDGTVGQAAAAGSLLMCNAALECLCDWSAQASQTAMMVGSGCVEAVTGCLAQQADAEGILTYGTRALLRLAGEGEEACARIAAATLPVLLPALDAHLDYPKFVEAAVALLHAICQYDAAKEAMLRLGGVEILRRALEVAADRPATAALAAELLELLSSFSTATPEEVAAALAAMNALVPRLAAEPAVAPALDDAVGRLSNMALNADNAAILRAADGVAAVCAEVDAASAASEVKEQESLLTRGALCLSRLSARSSEDALRNAKGDPRAVRTLLDSMRNNMHFKKLVEYALGGLLNLAKSDENLREIIAQGGVELILEALRRYGDDEAMALLCRKLLREIARLPEGAAAIIAAGGLPFLLEAMEALMQSASNVRLGMATLRDCAAVEDNVAPMVKAGTVPVCMAALEKHKNDSGIAALGMDMMCLLASDGLNSEVLRRAGGVDTFLTLMKLHPLDDAVLAAGVRALALITRFGDCEAVLIRIRESWQDASRADELEDALQCGALLARVVANRDYFVEHGATPLVLDVATEYESVPRILLAALAFLAELAGHPDAAALIRNAPVFLRALQRLLEEGADGNEQLQRAMMALLARLVDSETAAEAMAAAGGVRAVVSVLDAAAAASLASGGRGGVSFLTRAALAALRSFAEHLPDGAMSVLVEDQGVQLAMRLLRQAVRTQNSELALEVLAVLSLLAEDDDTRAYLLNAGVADVLAEALGTFKDEPAVVAELLRVLRKFAADDASATTLSAAVAAAVTAALAKATADDLRDLGMDALRLLLPLGQYKAARAALQAAGAVEATKALQAAFPEDAVLQELAEAVLLAIDPDLAAAGLEGGDVAGVLQCLLEGSVHPRVRCKLSESLMALCDLTEDDLRNLSEDVIPQLLRVMEAAGDMEDVLAAALAGLARLVDDDRMLDALIAAEGLESLLNLMRNNMGNVALLEHIIYVLSRLALRPALKEHIVRGGGVELVQAAVNAHLATAIRLCQLSCECLGNLAFASEGVAAYLVKVGTISLAERVMNAHASNVDVLSRIMAMISNIIYGNDEHRLAVTEACGDEIVQALRDHGDNRAFFLNVLRCLGNLAYNEDNLPTLVGEGASGAIVQALRTHWWEEEEVMVTALAVIANLAADSAPCKCVCERGAVRHAVRSGEDTLLVMQQEGTVQAVVQAIKAFEFNSAVLVGGVDALSNLSADPFNAEIMTRAKGLDMVLGAIESHDWDAELMESAMKLLEVLVSLSPKYADMVVEMGGLDRVLTCMASQPTAVDVLEPALAVLSRIAESDSEHCGLLVRQGGIEALVATINDNSDNPDFLAEPVTCLSYLTSVDELSLQVAEKAMPALMQLTAMHMTNPELLTHIFKLLGLLAFVDANLKVIVQFNGIALMIRAMGSNPAHADMLEHAVRTLDHLALGDEEHCAIVLAERGKDVIEVVLDAYLDNPTLVDVCNSALVTLGNYKPPAEPEEEKVAPHLLLGEKRKTDIEVEFAKHRNMLLSGKVMTKHGKSVVRRTILVSSDLNDLLWLEPKSKSGKGSMAIRDIVDVRCGEGFREVKKKRGLFRRRVEVIDRNTLTIIGKDRDLNLECSTSGEAMQWRAGLSALIAYRREKGILT
eukprot:PLAT7076.7.p1 GENE.PLAT7076.7~~PLAT7076.7.p1  ORF type:complete len:1902 (+),score=1256.63 PLAT7076.7:424-5706(+)